MRALLLAAVSGPLTRTIMVVAAEFASALEPLRGIVCRATTRPSESAARVIKGCMWEDNILPLGVGAVTEAKSWQAADAPGGRR